MKQGGDDKVKDVFAGSFWKTCLKRHAGMLLLFFAGSFVVFNVSGQVANYYIFSQTTGTYTPLQASYPGTPASVFPTTWDDNSTRYSIPFNFTYNGILYTTAGTIGVDSDGWLAFSNGAIVMTGQTGGGSWITGSNTGVYLNGTANNNGYCGFNGDLQEQTFPTFTGSRTINSPAVTGVSSTANLQVGTRLTGTGITDGTVITGIIGSTVTMSADATSTSSAAITPRSAIYAGITGIAPNRQFIIQWTEVKRFNGATADNFNFQLILNEGGGVASAQTVQVVYGPMTTTTTANMELEVGLRGASVADFNARRSLINWLATTTATANTDTVRLNTTNLPPAGLTFTWSPCTSAAGNAGTVSGTSSVCPNTSANYSLAPVTGATFYTWAYSGSGATFPVTTNFPATTLNFSGAAVAGNLTVTPGNFCGSGLSTSLPITVNALPAATISYPAGTYCNSSGSVTVTRTGTSGGTYSASPAGLVINSSSGLITLPGTTAATYTVTYSFTGGGCSNTATTTITIGEKPNASALATPASLCSGANSQLLAIGGNTSNYTVSSIAYKKLSPSGTPTTLWSSYTDEASSMVALPFTFTYFGQNITKLYVNSNGYVELQTNSATSATPQTLPDATMPNNLVAMAWEDLVVDPSVNAGAYVRYFVNGITPNRIMAIDYYNLSFFDFPDDGNVTGQVRLYEADNHIEVALGTVSDAGNLYTKTLGIENSTGTIAVAPPGRNDVVWNTVHEAWGFYPSGGSVSYLWTPSTFLSGTTINNPVAIGVTGITTYNVKITDMATGCFSNASATVGISSLSGTYTVGAAGAYPTLTSAVDAYNNSCISGPVIFSLIDANYSTNETFPITINSNSYQSATNTLTIQPAASVDATISGPVSGDALITITGKYININGSNNNSLSRNLSLSNTSTNDPIVVLLGSIGAAPVTNVSLKNCTITNGINTSSAVVVSDAGTVGNAGYFSNDTIQNNSIQKAYIGIFSVAAIAPGNGNIYINANDLNTSGTNALGNLGIYAEGEDGATIVGNNIGNFESANDEMDAGIWLATGTVNSTVERNVIHDIKYTGSSGYGGWGITLATGSASANIAVVNNMIYGMSGDGDDYTSYGASFCPAGIYAFGTGQAGLNIYHNSIYLNGTTLTKTNSASFGIALDDNSKASVKNNIIVNNLGRLSGTVIGSIAIAAATSYTQFTALDYNDYYINPAGTGAKIFGRIGAANQTSLSGWQTATQQEGSGLNVLPTFMSSTDLHIDSTNAVNQTGLSDRGTPIGIAKDYDNTTRNALTPDIGADEWLKPNTGSWVGKTSTAWTDPTNWETNNVPSSTTDIKVTGGYTFMPTVSAAQAVRNISMSSPATLTINAGPLQVYGDITDTGGVFNASNGIMEFKRTGALQTISGSWFSNRNLSALINSNSTGVTLSAQANDTLRILSSASYGPVTNSAISTNGNLILVSGDSATARFGEIVSGSGNSINGNVIVERYIPASRKWRFLSIPTATVQTVKQSWMENNAIRGNTRPGYGTIITDNNANWNANGFDTLSLSGPSMKYFNPATTNYTGIPATGYLINTKPAYMCYVRGSRSSLPVPVTLSSTVLRTTGPLKTAIQVFSIGSGEFAAIGNPYASSIDLRKLDTVNITDFFYVWDPNLTGTAGLGAFQTLFRNGTEYNVIPGGGSYGNSGSIVDTIQSGQAFFARAKSGGGSVTFKEAAKTIGSRDVFFIAGSGQSVKASLNLVNADGSVTLMDGVMAAFDDRYSNDVDFNDAVKMANASENVGLLRNGILLSIERHKPVVYKDSLFINLGGMRQHAYQWEFFWENMDAPGRTGFLIDNYTHTSTPLSLTGTTLINFTVDNNAASAAAGRFIIVFGLSAGPLPVNATGISATRISNTGVMVKWKIENETGVLQYELERSADGIYFSAVHTTLPVNNNGGATVYGYNDLTAFTGNNFYRVKTISRNGQLQYSIVVKVLPVELPPGISIYPNPVADKTLNISFNNMPYGNYSLQLINKPGQVIYTNTAFVNTTHQLCSFMLDKNIVAGTYELKVVDLWGNITVIQVEIL